MSDSNNTPVKLDSYPVWDRSVRIFHWLNVICVIGLIAIGTVILFNKNLGVSADGKILLKTIHVYLGYIFVFNLIWRFIWFFVGNQYSRLGAILPFGAKYKESLTLYAKGMKNGDTPGYLGHNPVARLMIVLLFLLLSVQAVTGLVLAGTDLYMPPFGHEIAEWVTNTDEDHGKLVDLKPGSKENVNPESYKEMRSFRKPFISAHKYAFYTLLAAIFLHIAGVVVTELRERNGIISAMFTGNKVFSKKPVDTDD
jgi:Ni/Fe-hydrogenase 1 B-type cytochrome subunit